MLKMRVAAVLCLTLLVSPIAFAESATIVSGTLTTPEGEIVKFKALDGAMVTLTNEAEGYRLGFTPVVLDAQAKKVRFAVSEITDSSPGKTDAREVEQIEVAAGSPAKTKAAGPVTVSVTDVQVK